MGMIDNNLTLKYKTAHKMTQNIVIACLNFNLLCKGVLEHISIANTKLEGWGCVQNCNIDGNDR
jgi:hypothetical protein